MNLLQNWIFLSIFAAITFGLGDFVVVLSEEKKMDVFTLYMTYTIIVGMLSLIFMLAIEKNSLKQIIIIYIFIYYNLVSNINFQILIHKLIKCFGNIRLYFHSKIIPINFRSDSNSI